MRHARPVSCGCLRHGTPFRMRNLRTPRICGFIPPLSGTEFWVSGRSAVPVIGAAGVPAASCGNTTGILCLVFHPGIRPFLSAPVPVFHFRGSRTSRPFAPSVCLLAHPFSGAPRSTLSRSGFLFFLEKERECGLFPANFVYLQTISCVHARKTCKTDCRLRYQYHCRKVPELSAHALLYPHFRAGDLWYRHGYLRPDPAGAHAADDGYGVELFPFLGQSRRGGRRREGRQTQAFCHDMGRHLACRRRFLCRRRLLP